MICEELERLFRVYDDAVGAYSQCVKRLSDGSVGPSDYDTVLRASKYARLIVNKTERAYKDHACRQCLRQAGLGLTAGIHQLEPPVLPPSMSSEHMLSDSRPELLNKIGTAS